MNNTPITISFYRDKKGLTTIEVEDGSEYMIVYDEYTGDYLVSSEDEGDVPVNRWLKTEAGAVQYILERLGVIEDGNYEIAPDRTSA